MLAGQALFQKATKVSKGKILQEQIFNSKVIDKI